MPSANDHPAGWRSKPTISHAHARLLAWLWKDDRPDAAVTVLARTGAIPHDTEAQLWTDLRTLTEAARSSGDPGETVCEVQIKALLRYVRHHGPRDAVPHWSTLPDDGQFVRVTRRFARARRAELGVPLAHHRPSGGAHTNEHHRPDTSDRL